MLSLDVHVSDAPRVLLEGAASEDVVKVQGSLAPGEHGGLAPTLDVSVTIAHYRVELSVVTDTRVLGEHGLGGAVAPTPVNLESERESYDGTRQSILGSAGMKQSDCSECSLNSYLMLSEGSLSIIDED